MRRVLLAGHDKAVADFVAQFAPIERPAWAPDIRAFGILNEKGSLVAGVVFSNWRPKYLTVELSAAAVSFYAFSIEIVEALGDHIFRQLSYNRIEARTAETNERAKRMLRWGLGFTPEGVQADYYGPRRHAAIYRLLKSEWERRDRPLMEARKAA